MFRAIICKCGFQILHSSKFNLVSLHRINVIMHIRQWTWWVYDTSQLGCLMLAQSQLQLSLLSPCFCMLPWGNPPNNSLLTHIIGLWIDLGNVGFLIYIYITVISHWGQQPVWWHSPIVTFIPCFANSVAVAFPIPIRNPYHIICSLSLAGYLFLTHLVKNTWTTTTLNFIVFFSLWKSFQNDIQDGTLESVVLFKRLLLARKLLSKLVGHWLFK